MEFAEKHRALLLAEYENKSTYQLAEELGTYPNRINRALKYLGVKVKSKSDAQKMALANGRNEHPNKGKIRSEETKVRISEGVHKYWGNLTDEQRADRVIQCQEQWEKLTPEQKHNLQQAAGAAIRMAAKDGSKMEKFLTSALQKEGYDVIFHKKGLVINSNLEVDLFIPALKVAIEIDGPAHFFPIWGQDSLNKHIKADAEKSGLLLHGGFCVLRIKHLVKSLTEKHKRDVAGVVIAELKKIEKKFPTKNKRYIELEVN